MRAIVVGIVVLGPGVGILVARDDAAVGVGAGVSVAVAVAVAVDVGGSACQGLPCRILCGYLVRINDALLASHGVNGRHGVARR